MSLSTIIRRKYNEFFAPCFDLKKIMAAMISEEPLVETPKDGIAYFIMARVFKTYGVVLNLCRYGHGEDAEVLNRTLFDAFLIVASVLKDEKDDTAWRYLNFDDVIKDNMLKKLKKRGSFREYFEERKNNPKKHDESIDDIVERAQKMQALYQYESKFKWYEGPIGKLAESVDASFHFEMAYDLQSQLVHTVPSIINRYIRNDGNKLEMLIQPSTNYIDMALVSAFTCAVLVADKFDTQFQLGYSENLKRLTLDWKKVVGHQKGDRISS